MRFEWAALMGKLIYAANISLDGYLEDETGSFDWSVPDDEVHAFWNEHERHIGTSLHGRRMYETMRVWEDDDWLTTAPAPVAQAPTSPPAPAPAPAPAPRLHHSAGLNSTRQGRS